MHDSDNESKNNVDTFDINTFNNIASDNIQQTIVDLNSKIVSVSNEIDILRDSIFHIDTNLKMLVIQQKRQAINKTVRHKQNDLKKLQNKHKNLNEQMLKLNLEQKSKYFEKFNAKIMNPASYIRYAYGKTTIYNERNFKQIYKNVLFSGESFVDKWLLRSNVRTYEKIDFLPPPNHVHNHIYNSFDGFAVVCKEDTDSVYIQPILNHVMLLVNHDSYEYILNYLAHLIQKPGELPLVALVFRSEKEGVGKNLFFEMFLGNMLLGSKYMLQTADIDKILGRFSMINDKLLVILDEAKGKDTFLNNEKIKNFITSPHIAWERKGIDGIKINNFARLLFFTNADKPVPIPFSDRRFACFDCSNEKANDRNYFKMLMKSMKCGYVSFYQFLKDRDISDFDIVADKPQTAFYRELQQESIPCIARFLIDYMFDASNNDEIYAKDMYNQFNQWCKNTNRVNINYTDTRFGRELKKYDGITKKRTMHGNQYNLNFDIICKYLIKKEYLTEKDCLIVD